MSDNVKCILLKINEDELLMPSASVAEIIPIKNIINVVNKPSWMLGYLDWRGNSVPLISLERMNEGRMPSLATGKVKAAILVSIGDDNAVPFISILTQDAPKTIHVGEDDVLSNEDPILHPAIADNVMLGNENYSIIDLEKLELMVKDVMA